MKNKKGELTSKQLITIIILIVSFAIIIAFFVMLGLKSIISDETCRNSVMMKGIRFGDWVFSLKCKTEDICFSMGGECSVETDRTIKVTESGLYQEMDGLQKNCGWMMGEGKVNYGKKGDCAICYKVYFDSKIQSEIPRITDFTRPVYTNKGYALVTGIGEEEHLPATFIEFSADELKKFGCSNFVTEV